MYFLSQHSTDEMAETSDILIGVHDDFLYSANSSDSELHIYRKSIIDSGDWRLFRTLSGIQSYSECSDSCVSVAYGIVGDELYIGLYGTKSDEGNPRFHLSSINLSTSIITTYSVMNNISALASSLCICYSGSYITSNPSNSSELYIYPNNLEIDTRISDENHFLTNFSMYKLTLKSDNSCTIDVALDFYGESIESNIGIVDFGKVIYASAGKLILANHNGQIEGDELSITEDSDLKNWISLGFYQSPQGLICIATTNASDDSSDWAFNYNCFRVIIDERKLSIQFEKQFDLPSTAFYPNPRYSRFILHPKYVIYSDGPTVYTHVLGLLSLSEIAFCAIMNFQTESAAGSFFDEQPVGLSQRAFKKYFGFPPSFPLVRS